ncbi:MAG: hypothetical protein E7365_07505 [Clostridiales bacterium]|nr:hypothetical protein [Clostridiales bacterium]
MENIKLKPQEIFLEYQSANEYKNSIGDRGIYEQSKMNERFYVGDQWHGVQAGNTRPLVRRNIIKRIGEYKISNICASPVTVNYSCEGVPTESVNAELLTAVPSGKLTNEEISSVMRALSLYQTSAAERIKFNEKIIDMVREAYIAGTSFFYTYWDDRIQTGLFADEDKTSKIMGDINCQVLNVVNVVLGDPNLDDIQDQPYIIISQRKPLWQVKQECLMNKGTGIEKITSNEDSVLAGDRGEKEPEDNKNVTVLTKFYKVFENGSAKVKAIRVTENAVVRNEWDLNIGLYPLAKFSWMPRFSCAYGDSEITYLIPNQIAINRALSAAVWSLMITGMPKIIVNRDIVGQAVTNDPGQIINIAAGEDYDVHRALQYVHPPQFAQQMQGVVNDIALNTLYDSGANDAALGDLRPDNASAVIAIREAALAPMQVYQTRFYSCVEDIARIWAEFWVNMYGQRPLKIQDKNGVSYMPFNAERYKNLVINTKVDVGASTLWGESVVLSSLDNLLKEGIITPLQYLERIPKGTIPDITGLIDQFKQVNDNDDVIKGLMEQYPEEFEIFSKLTQEEKTSILQGIGG